MATSGAGQLHAEEMNVRSGTLAVHRAFRPGGGRVGQLPGRFDLHGRVCEMNCTPRGPWRALIRMTATNSFGSTA